MISDLLEFFEACKLHLENLKIRSIRCSYTLNEEYVEHFIGLLKHCWKDVADVKVEIQQIDILQMFLQEIVHTKVLKIKLNTSLENKDINDIVTEFRIKYFDRTLEVNHMTD